jgi:hypothetical protein
LAAPAVCLLMRPKAFPILLIIASAALGTSVQAGGALDGQRVAASYLIAFGRAPTDAEIARSRGGEAASAPMKELLRHRRDELKSDAALETSTLARGFFDALGRKATEEESRAWAGKNSTYTEVVSKLLERLRQQPREYRQVQDRAYRFLLGRAPYDLENAYWEKYDTLPYHLLLACLDNWARRNQPGLMVTSGVPTISLNSRYLDTVQLSHDAAGELRAAAGLPEGPVLNSHFSGAAFGRNIVAPGAGEIASAGRISFVAAGADLGERR